MRLQPRLLSFALEQLVDFSLQHNFKQHKSHQVMYYAIFCSSLQLTAACRPAAKARNHATSLRSVLIATAHAQTVCWAAGETRDTGPGFKQTRGPDSLRDSGRDLLRACDFRETAIGSVCSGQSEHQHALTTCRHRKILSRKNYFQVKLEFFPELKTL